MNLDYHPIQEMDDLIQVEVGLTLQDLKVIHNFLLEDYLQHPEMVGLRDSIIKLDEILINLY